MFLFFKIDGYFIKTSLLILYFAFLLWFFGKRKKVKIQKDEKAFRKRLCSLLETEDLPLYKGQNVINWSKVYTLLKSTPPSSERDEIMEIVKKRKDSKKK